MLFIYIKKLFKPFASRQLRVFRAFLIVLILNLAFGVAFYFAERGVQDGLTLLDSLWWAMVTMTTVGYGDFYAQTPVGRFIISYACFLLGIGAIGYILGTIAEGFFNRISNRRNGLMTIRHQKHIIICNSPSTPRTLQLVKELRANPVYAETPVVVISAELEEIPDGFREMDIDFVKGSPLEEDILHRANVRGCQGVIIQAVDTNDIGSDAKSFATGTLVEIIEKECDHPIKTVVELVSEKNEKMLLRSKIDGVVPAGALTDQLLIQEFMNPGIRAVYEQLVTNFEGSQLYIVDTKWIGKTFVDLQVEVLKNPVDAQIVGILRNQAPTLNPAKTTVIENNDRLILLAKKPDDFSRIEATLFQNA